MSSEYSVYGVEQYTKAQDALREFKACLLCARGDVKLADPVIRRLARIPQITTIQ